MKLLVLISIVLAFLMIGAGIQKVDFNGDKQNDLSLGVISVHDLELKPGVDAKEFETFVMKEIAPIYKKMKGQNLILVKGDRGVRTEKYAIILTFESIEDRDRIYPPSGEFVGDFGEASIWEKFDSMANGLGAVFTDYVRVVH